jgi:hypothetical protein
MPIGLCHFKLRCIAGGMGVSFKSLQLPLSSEVLRRPQFFTIKHSQAEMSSCVATGLLWGLAVRNLRADLPFHEMVQNFADFKGDPHVPCPRSLTHR